jgi:6-phosphofructokinase 1
MEVARIVKERLDYFDTKVTVIGHLQRGGSPTCMDRVLSSRLGNAAVEALMQGMSNRMVGIIDNKIAYTTFDDAINKSKPIDEELLKLAHVLAL